MTTEPPEPTAQEEAQLRLALGMIGDEAHRDTPAAQLSPPPRPQPRPRRRAALLTAAGAATAAAVLAVLLIAWHDSSTPDDEAGRGASSPSADGGQALSGAEYLACARTIVQGDILRVRDAPRDGRVLVTLDVKKWIKPSQGKQRIELDLLNPAQARARPPFKTQHDVLLVVPRRSDIPADAYGPDRRERVRTLLNRDLPRAAHTTCPPYWRHTTATPTADTPGDA